MIKWRKASGKVKASSSHTLCEFIWEKDSEKKNLSHHLVYATLFGCFIAVFWIIKLITCMRGSCF